MQRSGLLCYSPQGYSAPARSCRSIPQKESSPYPRKRSVARRLLYSSGFVFVLASCLQSIPTTFAQVDEPYDPDVSRLVGRFLHITDIHPDEHYITGGSISSSCHRNSTDSDEGDVGVMRPGRIDGGIGGIYGSPYSICDSPFSLANATFDWIDKNLINNIDFVVWTGDNARHDSDNEYPRTQNEIEDLNKNIAKKFLEIFTPDKDDPFQQRIPIVPSIGNNDVYPHNIMQAGPNRILQHFSDIWSEFIPESQYHTFQHGGYYISEVIPDKIAVVALNTLYFFNQNAAVDGCRADDEPGTDQMDWLEVELEFLRKRKMTAYLTGHVPPARKSYSVTCFARYTAIALKYQDVIVGHLYGHANIDHFFLLSQASLSPEMVEKYDLEEEEEAGVAKKEYQVSLRAQRRYEQDEDDEYDPFHAMGLNSYLLELWDQYKDIPLHAKLSDFAIVLVGPSVVPTYNPTLRVFSYQLAIEKDTHTPATISRIAMEEEDEEIEEDEEFEDSGKKKKKKKKPKKPTKPANPPAALPITFGFPLNYTQYWMNLTEANEQKQPVYTVEYTSQEAYGMKELSVTHFLALARQIVKDANLKSTYLARMVVQTGTENDH
ncbi:Endopolyphosphatase [Podila minutissima]|nr:Endopolyphosphatase [Podila minutissima]